MHHKDDNFFKAAQSFVCILDHLLVENPTMDAATLRSALLGKLELEDSKAKGLSAASLNLRSALVKRYATLIHFTPTN